MTTEERLDQMEETIVKIAARVSPDLFGRQLPMAPEVLEYMRLDLADKLLKMTQRIMERKGFPIPPRASANNGANKGV